MQSVSLGDNLHEMSKPTFWEKEEKYFKMLSAEIFTQHAKHQLDTLTSYDTKPPEI